MAFNHGIFEKNSIILLVGILLVVSIGGLVEIAPLFLLDSTIEKVRGMRPYSPLELAGREVYIREGCYNCHSQMIRSIRDEVERYGHYSLAAESMYDHPFQWGSKRTGPDLARVGGKYSDGWHVDHMKKPSAVVQGTVMPGYPFSKRRSSTTATSTARWKRSVSRACLTTDDMIAKAKSDLETQVNPDAKGVKDLIGRYPKAQVRNFDGHDEADITELDALIAYLQMLGTLVDFASFDASGPNVR